MQTETKRGRDKREESARCESHTNHKHTDISLTYAYDSSERHTFSSSLELLS